MSDDMPDTEKVTGGSETSAMHSLFGLATALDCSSDFATSTSDLRLQNVPVALILTLAVS